jgi:hypothetical protein
MRLRKAKKTQAQTDTLNKQYSYDTGKEYSISHELNIVSSGFGPRIKPEIIRVVRSECANGCPETLRSWMTE